MAKKTWDESKMKAKVEKLRAEGKAFSEIQREFGGKQGDGSYRVVQKIAKAWDAAHPAQAAKLHVGRTLAAVASPKKAKAPTAPKPHGGSPKKRLTARDRVREQRQTAAKALQATIKAAPVASPAPATSRRKHAA